LPGDPERPPWGVDLSMSTDICESKKIYRKNLSVCVLSVFIPAHVTIF
jgi:hypothetical protein